MKICTILFVAIAAAVIHQSHSLQTISNDVGEWVYICWKINDFVMILFSWFFFNVCAMLGVLIKIYLVSLLVF